VKLRLDWRWIGRVCAAGALGLGSSMRGFDSKSAAPANGSHLQIGPALGAGFIAGAVLLLVPRGSPWSTTTFFSPVIMGRSIASAGLPLLVVWCLHIGVALVYGLIISRVVAGLTYERAFLAGAITGSILYGLNLAAFSLLWPEFRGPEVPVVFAHLVFGLIAAGAYRGLLKRQKVEPVQPYTS
jgi:hypothetical protein